MSLSDRFRNQGLLPSTKKKYFEILAGADRKDLICWIHGRCHARTPIGTLLPMRAAVKHYLIAVLGYDEEEVGNLLPKAKGRPAQKRTALSPHQLALYHAAVEQIGSPKVQTILALLPSTGLRIGEITALREQNLRGRPEGRMYLQFRGKRDKERIVPLTSSAKKTLESYRLENVTRPWLFPSFTGKPITPHAVRKHTRRIARENPELGKLTPHVLRHTFATMALRKGIDLKNLQALMGHESIQTTSRYLHPSLTDLQESMDRLETP